MVKKYTWKFYGYEKDGNVIIWKDKKQIHNVHVRQPIVPRHIEQIIKQQEITQ